MGYNVSHQRTYTYRVLICSLQVSNFWKKFFLLLAWNFAFVGFDVTNKVHSRNCKWYGLHSSVSCVKIIFRFRDVLTSRKLDQICQIGEVRQGIKQMVKSDFCWNILSNTKRFWVQCTGDFCFLLFALGNIAHTNKWSSKLVQMYLWSSFAWCRWAVPFIERKSSQLDKKIRKYAKAIFGVLGIKSMIKIFLWWIRYFKVFLNREFDLKVVVRSNIICWCENRKVIRKQRWNVWEGVLWNFWNQTCIGVFLSCFVSVRTLFLRSLEMHARKAWWSYSYN